MTEDRPMLAGYRFKSVLYRTNDRVVYRAERLEDGVVVAIETFDSEYPNRQQVASVRRGGRIAQRLADIKGVCSIHAILPHGSGNLALVIDLFEQTLKSRLLQEEGIGLPLHEVLNIAVQLVCTLGDIHAQNIVHKALSPEHILYNPATGEIAITGFGIASELDQERQAEHLSRRLEGPLPYMSPEQTGRMNRELDYRSDYYSLGALLFELLTGKHLFQAEGLLEWVHSHISQLPPVPHEVMAEIPEAVSAILLKLLSKNPEARYQSAAGLMYDLAYCVEQLAGGNLIEHFEPGQKDMVHKFLVPQALYGRERELVKLFDLFESVVAGGTAFCLVHGYSGVGKSALVNEIDRPLVRERGFLIQGKFQQFQQGEAYSAIAAAFRGLIQQILSLSDEKVMLWREVLLKALVPNANLVIALVPELALIIGPQPDVVELPPAEARNRLHIVLTAFLRACAGEGHPVVLFLDDLQWSDTPTLELLRRLMTSHDLSHLLLIGAYRSNEVGPGHPLGILLDDIQQHKPIHQLPLGPLDKISVANLVADGLRRDPAEIRPLSDMIFEKAQGNPFFTNELLRQLHKDGAITPDIERDCWRWDLNAVLWSEVSHDVVEFMVDNLRQFQTETQRVLQLAACIGGTFDLNTLSLIYEHSPVETAVALLPALKQHTVLPLHTDYRLVEDDMERLDINPTYRFQHDRVQQAAYALIDVQQLQTVHLAIGRLMLAHSGKVIPDESLIEIVTHFNQGRSLITLAEERLHLAELNLSAGVRARQASAYETALEYLHIASELLPEDPWQFCPVLMQQLAIETQQCAYLAGSTDEAENWIAVMLEHVQSKQERSDILATCTRQYATLGRMDDSIHAAIQGLALLGVSFTQQPSDADITEERRLVSVYLKERDVADLVDAPLVEDTAILTAMRLLMEIFPAAFLSGSGKLFPYLVLKSVNLSLRYGNCPESAFAYAAYGMLLCGELDEPALGYQYGQAGLAINERIDDLALRARVIYVYAMFVHHWSNHWSSLTPWFRKGIEAGYQSGDLLYLAYSAQDCVIWDPSLDLETAHRLHAENLEIVRECAYQDSLDSGTLFLQLQRNLLGLTHSTYSLSDEHFAADKCLAGMRQRQFMTGIANYHIYHAEIGLLYGNIKMALEHVRAQDELIKSAMSLPQLVRFYIVSFLTLSTCYSQMNEKERVETRERMGRDLNRMRRWADNCETNFRHLQFLMEAELDWLDGYHDLALGHFDQAIDAARESGFLRDEAMASERAARFMLSRGYKRAAEGYLRGALCLYDRWGAHRKVNHLLQEFPVLNELKNNASSTASVGDLDLASVMKASRVISSEIVLEKLLNTTMNIMLENAGGQWGCLIVRREGHLQVAVYKQPIDDLSIHHLPNYSLLSTETDKKVPLPMTLISNVLHSGEAVVLHDATHDGLFVQDPYVVEFQPLSVLCIPIQREHFEGVLYMENNLSNSVFTEERVEVIRLLVAQASVAIENASLYEQVQEYSRTLEDKVTERTARLEQLNQELQDLADCDGLTGVANRRRCDVYMAEVWARLRRDKQPLSIIMLDVDHFKTFNDNYGHQAGDDCLVAVAEAAQAQLLRPTDMIARYGGEEFILILPNTDYEGATQVGEKVRSAVEALAVEHIHSSTGNVITISAGTATMVPDSESGMEHLLKEADIALYRAKRMGRNQVQSASFISL